MKLLERISDFAARYMACIVVFFSALALFFPAGFLWIKPSCFTTLLMTVMFGMGLTLTPGDFALLLRHPRDIFIGCLAQYTIMPLLAFAIARAFDLDDALTVGVILVGTCPGGTASNVITYLSRGNVALSVGMTCASTLLAPVLTPLLTWIFLHETIKIDILSMFLSILQIVILPIVSGFLINHWFGGFSKRAVRVLPLVSVAAIVAIIAAIVAINADRLMSTGLLVLAVVFLHNGCGFALGYLLAVWLKMPLSKKKAVAIEVGMQNSGLAVTLAHTSFNALAMATVPGAIFSIWHNISGSMLANWFARQKDD